MTYADLYLPIYSDVMKRRICQCFKIVRKLIKIAMFIQDVGCTYVDVRIVIQVIILMKF